MPHLSVIENVMLGQHVRVKGSAGALCSACLAARTNGEQLAEESLRDAGIDVIPTRTVSTLSYGIAQNGSKLCVRLMSQPRLLMLDEPAAGLNMRETAELSAFLESSRAGRPHPAWSLSTICLSSTIFANGRSCSISVGSSTTGRHAAFTTTMKCAPRISAGGGSCRQGA